jgi:hypothetical protein
MNLKHLKIKDPFIGCRRKPMKGTFYGRSAVDPQSPPTGRFSIYFLLAR